MDTARPFVQHILAHLRACSPLSPLFVGLQGPQGSGKSYLSALLKSILSSPPHSLNVTLLSIDDLYLPHAGLRQVAHEHSENFLLQGRGQPGTHDTELGLRIFSALKLQQKVELPHFDKSLHNGEGDRLPMQSDDSVYAQPPIDVVIFEGWCVGFCPIPVDELERRWNNLWTREQTTLQIMHTVRKADVEQINEKLNDYLKLWSFLDVFLQIKPSPVNGHPSKYSIIYRWRLEQEHSMKNSNGGRGMPDEAIKTFVDRYIPGYVFFGDIPPNIHPKPRWLGSGLAVLIDESRRLVDTQTF